MNAERETCECQIYCVPRMALPVRLVDRLQHLYSRTKRFLWRRMIYSANRVRKASLGIPSSRAASDGKNTHPTTIYAGDLVRIRSRKDIEATLDDWNRLRGCTFLAEMWPYCGTEHHVMKRVERFLDERDYHMKKTKGILALEGVICEGTVGFGRCDRSCFFFWREEWLEKVE